MRLPRGLTGPNGVVSKGEVVLQVNETNLLEYGTKEKGNHVSCFVSVKPGDIITLISATTSGTADFADLIVDGILRDSKVNTRCCKVFTCQFDRALHNPRKEGKRARGGLTYCKMQVQPRNTEKDVHSFDTSKPSAVGDITFRIYRPEESNQPVSYKTHKAEVSTGEPTRKTKSEAHKAAKLDRGPKFVDYASWSELNCNILLNDDEPPPPYEIGFVNTATKSGSDAAKKRVTKEYSGEYNLWATLTFVLCSNEKLRGLDYPIPPSPILQAVESPKVGMAGMTYPHGSVPQAVQTFEADTAEKANRQAVPKSVNTPDIGTSGVTNHQAAPMMAPVPNLHEPANSKFKGASIHESVEAATSSLNVSVLVPPVPNNGVSRLQTMPAPSNSLHQSQISQAGNRVPGSVTAPETLQAGTYSPSSGPILQDSNQNLLNLLNVSNRGYEDPAGETMAHGTFDDCPRLPIDTAFEEDIYFPGTQRATPEPIHCLGFGNMKESQDTGYLDLNDIQIAEAQPDSGTHVQFTVPQLNPEDLPKIESIEADDMPNDAGHATLRAVNMVGPAYQALQEREGSTQSESPHSFTNLEDDEMPQVLSATMRFQSQEHFSPRASGLSEPLAERMKVGVRDRSPTPASKTQEDQPSGQRSSVPTDRTLNLHPSNYHFFGFGLTNDDRSTTSPPLTPPPSARKPWIKYHREKSAPVMTCSQQSRAASTIQHPALSTTIRLTPRQCEKRKADEINTGSNGPLHSTVSVPRKETTAPALRHTAYLEADRPRNTTNGIGVSSSKEMVAYTHTNFMRKKLASLSQLKRDKLAAEIRYSDAFRTRNITKNKYEEVLNARKERAEIQELHSKADELEIETADLEAKIEALNGGEE